MANKNNKRWYHNLSSNASLVFRVKVVLRGLHLVCSFESIGSFGWLGHKRSIHIAMLENGATKKKQGATDQREQSLSGLRWMSEVGNFWNPPLAASETCSDHSNQGTCVSMPLGAKDWINAVETRRGREFGGSYPMHHFGINSSIPLKPVLSVLGMFHPTGDSSRCFIGDAPAWIKCIPNATTGVSRTKRNQFGAHGPGIAQTSMTRDAGRSLSSFFMSIRPVSRSQPVG